MAAYLNGELIVDAWAAPDGVTIDGDSLLPMYSTGKAIMATTIHLMVERGLLDYDTPLAYYWPEFAANDKGTITLHQLEIAIHRHGTAVRYVPAARWRAFDHQALQ